MSKQSCNFGVSERIPTRQRAFPTLTSRVDVKVGGLVRHVACGVQTWSPGMHFTWVTHDLCYIHHIGALVDVLTGKEHRNLERKSKTYAKTYFKKMHPCCTRGGRQLVLTL